MYVCMYVCMYCIYMYTYVYMHRYNSKRQYFLHVITALVASNYCMEMVTQTSIFQNP